MAPIALLMLLFAASTFSPSSAVDFEFCTKLTKSFEECPNPPTVNTVDLQAYQGRWYEIGVSAQFAFGFILQAGGQCVSANYTALGLVNGTNSVKVFNQQVIVQSFLRRGQVVAIAKAAQGVGFGVLGVCRALVGGRMSVFENATVLTLSKAILGAAAGTPIEAVVAQHVAFILSKVNSSSQAAQTIYQTTASIQLDNNILNGAMVPKPIDANKTAAGITAKAGAIAGLSMVIKANTEAIAEAAKNISMVALTTSPQLFALSAALMALTRDPALLSLSTNGILLGSGSIAKIADTVTPEDYIARPSNITGVARQNATEAGKLKVQFFQGQGNYWIIRLIGPAFTGYELAYVFSCSVDATNLGVPENAFFLLSRTPTVPPAVVDEALKFVLAQGIPIGGDNVFVPVSQDPTFCFY